jgi:hypothetical protein
VSASWPASGGVCTCKCGVNAATADYTYLDGSGDTITMQSVAASGAACTSATCASTYVSECGSAAYTSATYASYTSMAVTPAPTTNSAGICTVFTATCSAAAPCMPGMTTGSVTTYASVPDVATCNIAVGLGASISVLCASNNCNSPSSSSAAASAKPAAMALAAAVGAAAVAAYM